MATTQSDDPNENVNHPRWYTAHPSGIECIEITEHLPFNLGNAVKYIWRCGLKTSSGPLRDLRSAEWYVRREISRRERFSNGEGRFAYQRGLGDPFVATSAWLAQKIIEDAKNREERDLAALCLGDLLRDDLAGLLKRLEQEILSAQ